MRAMSVQALENTELSGGVAVDALVGQLGHLHDAGARGAFADIPLPRTLRDELIAAGRARPHSAMPDSGWLTVPVRTAADLAGAVEAFRLAYDRARRKRSPG